ncbi:hypothetical protein [Streptomyces brevispora]|uniref:Uncharacterized protein n=1 Tax=Streptomyces brevispora TaxID=887462 RepID=A0ABZ1FYY4_9ACTN|nr:hypothetical protein [Streptomyces brevispora]WSC12720.1 hypothetical protein OIE64_07635 [Streptomyces brevispora]
MTGRVPEPLRTRPDPAGPATAGADARRGGSGDAELARATTAHAGLPLRTIREESAKALGGLSTRATWAEAGLRTHGD